MLSLHGREFAIVLYCLPKHSTSATKIPCVRISLGRPRTVQMYDLYSLREGSRHVLLNFYYGGIV